MPQNPGSLILRCDASTTMGTGHVMRCLALAQAWQDVGGRAVFAMAEPSPAIRERLLAESAEVVQVESHAGSGDDAARVAECAQRNSAHWVVVDGYQFGAAYQRDLKAAGLKLLFLDDNGHSGHYSADLVLNQNVHADRSFYQDREPYTRLLLGPRYAMLRREFARWRDWKREIAPVGGKVLVTMGGSDPDNVTALVIEALGLVHAERLEAIVVVGGSNPHADSLQRTVAGFAGTMRLLKDVPNMPELMAWADLAVAGAGTTSWELCLLGLPAILIDFAENQRQIAKELDRLQIAVHFRCNEDCAKDKLAETVQRLLLSGQERSAMSLRGGELVDGKGALRVVSAIRSGTLHLQRAEQKDCCLLWEWANDPDVRAASFSPEPIAWEQHSGWFTKKLQDRRCLILIATDEEQNPIGQIRFDRTADREAEIDVGIAKEKRGRGYASLLIEAAAEAVFRDTDLQRLHALVKIENEASRKAFEAAGFSRVSTERRDGTVAASYLRVRN